MKTMGMAPSEDTIQVRPWMVVKGCPLIISVQKMIKAADSDGSGVVEFQEFMDMICDQMEVSLCVYWTYQKT